MRTFKSIVALLLIGAFALSGKAGADEDSNRPPEATVVLVHGLFADGSSWERVIPILQSKGLRVISVQNPLTSLADDVAATQRAIDSQRGPIVLVGHSWGGVVITQAGNDPKVAALVYVAAFAPSVGQSINSIVAGFPTPPWESSLEDDGGFLRLSPLGVGTYFAPDLPDREIRILTATQGPFSVGCLGDTVSKAASATRPSWWIIPANDQIINPQLQLAMAARINATVKTVESSHVVLLSHPREVADVIINAVTSVR